MQLYLLRHADADTPAASDDERRLSEKGIAQSHKIAAFCEARAIAPEVILSSPIRRALETAQIVAAKLKREPLTAAFLTSGMRPEVALQELRAHEKSASVMVVGHEPDFSRFAGFLLGLPTQVNIHVRKASLTLLALDMLKPATARLEFSVPCKLM